MKKTLLSLGRLVLLSSLTILPFISQAQVEGEFRTRQTYSGFTATSTWQIYNAATGWTNTSLVPGATSIATVRDGAELTSNSNGISVGTLNVGQGNPAILTATIDANGTVNSLTITNPGKLTSRPFGITFDGSASTIATATITRYTVTGAEMNFDGSGYTTATVAIGAAWAPSIAYTVNAQVRNGGNLYTCTTAGTSDATGTGPSGIGVGITDGTSVWSYTGAASTAEAVINGGKITGINITNPGSGYNSAPSLTITGDGTGASWTTQIGIEAVNLTSGGIGYAVAPKVIAGSFFIVGNASTSRSVTIGDLNFRSGANLYNGTAGTRFLTITGNLTAVTPISFRTVNAASASNTDVTFNKAGTSTATGNFTFNNLSVSANTTVNVVGSYTVLGTTNLNGTGVLPVDLVSFDAKKEINKVNINWLTASEVNNDKFEILKSSNGKDFTLLATVKAKGASGYTVVDNFPFNGSNYYKLLQYDLNGKVNEKGIRAVNFDLGNQKDASTIYPNPIAASGTATIKFRTDLKPKKLSLISSQGQVVYAETLKQESGASTSLQLKDQLTPGVYFLNMEGDFSKEVLKLIVQ
ncbi:hypothetical protein PBAC_13790 [Pedobacter glucosidilyticus]|nr:T9SS type A sorting domain-containing protein [Pedobacter glucosidilyticus]KHJ38373.1 hypothetical protein PBAC_13790 [Pedobacter glucosidilyticus]